MKGYRTYITLLIGFLYNLGRGLGIDFGDVDAEKIDIAVNTIILVVAGIFRYFATKKG